MGNEFNNVVDTKLFLSGSQFSDNFGSGSGSDYGSGLIYMKEEIAKFLNNTADLIFNKSF